MFECRTGDGNLIEIRVRRKFIESQTFVMPTLQLGHGEIGKPGNTSLTHQNIGGFDIAVDDLLGHVPRRELQEVACHTLHRIDPNP